MVADQDDSPTAASASLASSRRMDIKKKSVGQSESNRPRHSFPAATKESAGLTPHSPIAKFL